MRLVTWNVNSLPTRLPRVLELLSRHQPDVVCLQGIKCARDAFPATELATAGYTAIHHSAGRWAGVAVLAHAGLGLSDPVLELARSPAPAEARWCEAVVSGIRFVSVDAPDGRSPDTPGFHDKLAFLDAAVDRLRELAGEAVVLAGDLGIAPADSDVHDPAAFAGSVHVSPDERGRLAAMLDTGLVDAYRRLHPTEVQYTWWDDRGEDSHPGEGLRVDLALISSDLAERLRHCGTERDYRQGVDPSDHAPLVVDLSGSAR